MHNQIKDEEFEIEYKEELDTIFNFVKKELSATFNTDQISLRQLAELLASIHYTPDISLRNLESKEKLIHKNTYPVR